MALFLQPGVVKTRVIKNVIAKRDPQQRPQTFSDTICKIHFCFTQTPKKVSQTFVYSNRGVPKCVGVKHFRIWKMRLKMDSNIFESRPSKNLLIFMHHSKRSRIRFRIWIQTSVVLRTTQKKVANVSGSVALRTAIYPSVSIFFIHKVIFYITQNSSGMSVISVIFDVVFHAGRFLPFRFETLV